MIFSLHNRLMKKWDNVFQTSFLLLAFVSILACGLFSLYGTVTKVAYAQSTPVFSPAQAPIPVVSSPAPSTLIPAKLPTPPPIKVPTQQVKVSQQKIPQKIPQKVAPVAQVSQGSQPPVSMTISTTINNLQSLTPPQIQRVNVPLQVQNAQKVQKIQKASVSRVPVSSQVVTTSSPSRSAYGLTPCAPSLERNMYLDSVWRNLVPRRQLYADPALKMQKSRTGRSATVPKKKMSTAKKVASTPNNAQAGTASTNSAANMNKNAARQQNNSMPSTPFVPSAVLNPEIPAVPVPIPNALPAANVGVEPNLGTL